MIDRDKILLLMNEAVSKMPVFCKEYPGDLNNFHYCLSEMVIQTCIDLTKDESSVEEIRNYFRME